MMPLFERYGMKREGVDPARQLRAIPILQKSIAERSEDLWADLKTIALDYGIIAVRYYLLDDHIKAAQFARKCLESTDDYFFGDWRSAVRTDLGTIDPLWWREREGWIRLFSLSLMWASVLNDWPRIERLARYPSDISGLDTIGATPDLRQLHLDTAAFIRAGFQAKPNVDESKSNRVEEQKTALLRRCLNAIVHRNESLFNELINKFFEYHNKLPMSDNVIDSISVNGTFVFNLACHCNMTVCLDAKLRHHLVVLAT